MNRSHKFITLLLAAGLSVFAVAASAQSSVPGPGATTDPDHRTPPSLPPASPGESGSGENPIAYGPRGAITGSRVDEPGGIGFDEIDADRDGKISLSEFTRSPAVDASLSSRRGSVSGRSDSASTGGPSGASTGLSGGSDGAERRADAFSQLDRDRDGYLTRDEMDAGKRNSAGRIAP